MPVGVVTTREGTDIGPLLNAVATAQATPTRVLVALAIAESGLSEVAERHGGPGDKSFGLFQQTAVYASVGDHTESAANLAVCRAYYFDPAHAIADAGPGVGAYYRATQDYYATAAKWNGGPAATWATIPPENRANYARAWAEAAQYEQEAPMPTPTARTYDPDYHTPAYQQQESWTCSVCSTAWGIGSVGEAITPAQMQDAMTAAGLVDASVGLHDGSGAQLAAWLEATYGVQTERAWPASWDWIAERAGHGPVLMGAGHPWYHWVGVRDVYWCDDTVLLLANSADGYEGVAQTLTRERFATLGTFAAIWIKVDAPAPEDEVTQAEADALRQQLADANSAYGALAHDILGPTVEQLRALAAASSRTKPRDALQADLSGIADRLAEYVVA